MDENQSPQRNPRSSSSLWARLASMQRSGFVFWPSVIGVVAVVVTALLANELHHWISLAFESINRDAR